MGLEWLAGWLEGEGCFHVGRSKGGRLRLLLSGSSVDRDVVERAHRAAGCGTVYENTPTASGKPMFVWREENRENVVALCELLRPHMGTRRRAAIDAMLAAYEEYDPAYDRSVAARKMWATRRERYGPSGMRRPSGRERTSPGI